MKVIFYSLLAWTLFSDGAAAARCYLCGTGGDVEPCHLFDLASTWRHFEVDCPSDPPQGCVKTDGDGVVRGCTPLTTASGQPNAVGCVHTSQQTTLCICQSDLCNGARFPSAATAVTVALFITAYNYLF